MPAVLAKWILSGFFHGASLKSLFTFAVSDQLWQLMVVLLFPET